MTIVFVNTSLYNNIKYFLFHQIMSLAIIYNPFIKNTNIIKTTTRFRAKIKKNLIKTKNIKIFKKLLTKNLFAKPKKDKIWQN